jgi:hypothetical protein
MNVARAKQLKKNCVREKGGENNVRLPIPK